MFTLLSSMKVGAARGVVQLFDTVSDFRQRNFGNEQCRTGLNGNEIDDFGTRSWFTQFGNDVGI